MTPTASARGVVCLLARAPSAPGKTRLTAGLSSEPALALRRALFLDTLDAVLASGLPVVVCYTPANAREEFDDALAYVAQAFRPADGPQPVLALMPQSDGDLGARMHAAFVDAFALGFDRVVLIGSDLPTLPPEHLAMAMEALDRAPVVIGPADDGGYYLIGLREPHPELFDGVTWGSGDVLAQTMAIAEQRGAAVERAPAWHDVDAPGDLPRVASASRARHTRAWLEDRT